MQVLKSWIQVKAEMVSILYPNLLLKRMPKLLMLAVELLKLYSDWEEFSKSDGWPQAGFWYF